MRKLFQLTSLVAIIVLSCTVGDANAQWPEYTQIGETSYIEIGGRAYNRPGTDLDFAILQDATTAETLFSANQATSASSAAGVEMSYNFRTRHGRKMEFRTFLGNWDARSEIDQGNIASPLFPGQTADVVDYNYRARIFSFELNAKRPLAQGWTLFGGPRFVSLTDEISFVATQNAVFPASPVPLENRATAEAINNLIGLQAGLRYDKPLTQYFRASAFIRTGGYFNPTKLRTSSQSGAAVFGIPPTTLLRTEATKSTGSFLAEVGGKLYLDLNPHTALFAGYEATWIDGVALAPPTFLSGPGTVETANTLFMHAITFGARFGW